VGNPDLENERGDTWTLGMAMSSPFEGPLLERITATIDWYRARVTDPIEVLTTSSIVNSCYNVNGLNPTFSLDDPNDYCSLIERNPGTGSIERVYIAFTNQGELEITGVDMNWRWSASLADMGMDNAPGTLSVTTNLNYLLDQIRRYGVDQLGDYAGYGGAAKLRANTSINYMWDQHRVSLTWNYREGTDTATTFATVANDTGSTSPTLETNQIITGYKSTSLYNLTAGTMVGPVNASISISNLFDKAPRPGGYDSRDPRKGFGTFSPFDDLYGRRYSINLSMDF
jgi:hypothetical protein